MPGNPVSNRFQTVTGNRFPPVGGEPVTKPVTGLLLTAHRRKGAPVTPLRSPKFERRKSVGAILKSSSLQWT